MKKILFSLFFIGSVFGAVLKSDTVDRIHERVFTKACKHGDIKTVKFCLDSMGAKFFNVYGRQHIDCAIINGQLEVTKFLISKAKEFKYNIDFSDDKGCYLLIYSCERKRFDFVKILITHNADVDYRFKGETSLFISCSQKKLSRSIIKHLIINGVDIDDMIFSPMHVACIMGQGKKVRSLIALGANVNLQDRLGWTPLHWACKYGHLEIIKILLDNGANPGIADYIRNIPAVDACYFLSQSKCLDAVKLLMEKGFDINHRNNLTCNIFHIACDCNQIDLIRYLIEKDPNIMKTKTIYHLTGFMYINSIFSIAKVLYGMNIEDKYIPQKALNAVYLKSKLCSVFSIDCPKGYSICQFLEFIKQDIISSIKSNNIKKIMRIPNLQAFFSIEEIAGILEEMIKSIDYDETAVIELLKKIYLDYNLLNIVDSNGNNLLSQALFCGRTNLSLFLIYLKKDLLDGVKLNSFTAHSMCILLGKLNIKFDEEKKIDKSSTCTIL